MDQFNKLLHHKDLPKECKNVTVNTAESFQGREGNIVLFVLSVHEETGPLFLADPHRICVGLTRHRPALIVVGDIETADKAARTVP